MFFLFSTKNTLFGVNLVQKTIILSLSRNLVPILIWICNKKFTFSIFDQKHYFLANLVQKIKITSLSWNLVPGLIWISTIQWWYWLFCFWPKIPFWDKFVVKNENCQFKLKNLVPRLILISKIQWRSFFSFINQKYHFLV